MQRRIGTPPERGGLCRRRLRRHEGGLEMRQQDLAELGELGQAALEIQQRATELLLQALNRSRQPAASRYKPRRRG